MIARGISRNEFTYERLCRISRIVVRVKAFENFIARIIYKTAPAVAADNFRIYALRAQLFCDKRNDSVVIGQIYDIGVCAFNFRQLSPEVFIAGAVRFGGNNGSARFFKGDFKVFI